MQCERARVSVSWYEGWRRCGCGECMAWRVSGARGSCIVFSVAAVLGMIVVRGMRGVGGVCEMSMCLSRGGIGGGGGGEWMRRLGLNFTNPMGTGGVLDVCLYLGFGGVDGVGVDWVAAWDRVWMGGVVLCLCEL